MEKEYADLVEILLAISARPEMYFGPNPTLASFQGFALGYILAKDQIGSKDYMQFDYNFSNYIRNKNESNMHWTAVIDNLYDEKSKIKEFEFLLTQFKNGAVT